MPAIYIHEKNLPLAWEKSLIALYNNGVEMPTQYDKPGDKPSIDTTAFIVIDEPFSEPRIHRGFPGGITELEMYKQEVVDGVHDHWVDPNNAENEGWRYGYHERIFDYEIPENDECFHKENQYEYIIKTLTDCKDSRRAVASLWKPWYDPTLSDCPCLQHMQCRILNNKLNMHMMMRSNDAFKASFMNIYTFTELQKRIAKQLRVEVGQYFHVANSYHIYGSYLLELEGFIANLNKRTFEERTYRTDDPLIIELFEEARATIKNSIIEEKATGRKGI